ncbi:hypothetical protein LCGC14_2011910 [marine sediment metagenome]|uniref:Uncharacterized protein n=1 Tax=marine sediment metagenome TaxID=412755 RepID=A0A0F9F064_9ZZZZ
MSFNKDESNLTLSPYHALGQIEATITGMVDNKAKIARIAGIIDAFNAARAADLARLEAGLRELGVDLHQEAA